MQNSKTLRLSRVYFPPNCAVHVQSVQGSQYAESSLSVDKGFVLELSLERRIIRVWNSRRPPGSICRVTTIPLENVTSFEVYGDEELSERPETVARAD